VDYQDIRPLIKSGDALAWTHRGWGSWHDIKIQLVRMFTRSEFSHVAVAWVVGGRVFALEAVQPCVRIYPLSQLGDFYHLPTQPMQSASSIKTTWTDDVETFALSKVGEPYSQAQAVLSFFGSPKADRKWQCAEYAKAVLFAAGVKVHGRDTPTAFVQSLMYDGVPLTLVENPQKI
jgi:hypothetical protein